MEVHCFSNIADICHILSLTCLKGGTAQNHEAVSAYFASQQILPFALKSSASVDKWTIIVT